MMFAASFIALFVSIVSLIFGNDEAELLFVGDAMQHQAQIDAARCGQDRYSYDSCFVELKPIIEEADYAVVNYETPSSRPPYSGYPCFNAPGEFAKELRDIGFDLFLTANNHTLDRGASGLRNTLALFDSLDVAHIGTYSNDSSRTKSLPKIEDINGIKVAFLNYTYGTNGISPRDGVVVDYIDRAIMKADVESSRKAGAEIVAVCLHWGDEYKLLPNKEQKNLADFLEAIGVDMIIGGHPHVIQPMEFRPNKYIPQQNVLVVYSLGNFISNMKTTDTRGGAMVKVKLRRGDDKIVKIEQAAYTLLFTVPGNSPSNNFKVLKANNLNGGSWKMKADAFKDRAKSIFDKYNVGVPEDL